MSTQRNELVQRIASAGTFSKQVEAIQALDAFDKNERQAKANARSIDLAATTVTSTLTPVRVHERHTGATDWLGDYEPDTSLSSRQATIAEAALWYEHTHGDVKADREEFAIQAEGFMRREAGKYGEAADAVYQEGLAYLGHLYRMDHTAASGLDQVQQTVNPHEDPKATPLPTEVFDNFANEVDPINAGVVGTETSERNPLLQEIQGEGNGQGAPEVPGGHSTTNAPGAYSEVPAGGPADASSGPLGFAASLGWGFPSVAINHTMTLADFIKAEAASGLDEVQQVVDPHEDPKPTPLPTEVAYPWLLGPDAYGNGGEQKKEAAWDPENPEGLSVEEQQAHQQALADEREHGPAAGHEGARRRTANQDRFGHPEYNDHYQQGWDNSHRYGDPLEGDAYDEDIENGGDGTLNMDNGPRTQSQTGWKGAYDAYQDGWADHAAGRPHGSIPSDPVGHGYRSASRKQADAQCPSCGSGNVTRPFRTGPGNLYQTSPGTSRTGPGNLYTQKNPGGPNTLQCNDCGHKTASRKQADMFGNSDNPHAVPGPSPANTPQTAPQPGAGYAQGQQDALAGDHPTYADASSAAPQNVQQYARGYSDAVRQEQGAQDVPVSMGGDNGQGVANGTTAKISARFTKAAARTNAEFRKGYGFASRWAPGTPIVSLGSAEFESGLFAGIADRGGSLFRSWREANQRQASRKTAKRLDFGKRLDIADRYVAHLATRGIDVLAGTSTDLDTLAPSANPSPTGQTPINGPGTVPPLFGQPDPAAPGGPSPYNGAQPFGSPVVPTGAPQVAPGSNVINDTPGGPVDQSHMSPATAAFRKTVQAALAKEN